MEELMDESILTYFPRAAIIRSQQCGSRNSSALLSTGTRETSNLVLTHWQIGVAQRLAAGMTRWFYVTIWERKTYGMILSPLALLRGLRM